MKKMIIREITDTKEKQDIARFILESLTDWFGVSESRESYIRESADRFFAAVFDKDQPVGFICLKETGKDTAEISVMGVLKEYHRKGVGRALFKKAKEIAVNSGYSFLQVKTVQMGKYEDYDRTNRFYLALGFKEFEVLPDLWDENNLVKSMSCLSNSPLMFIVPYNDKKPFAAYPQRRAFIIWIVPVANRQE